MSFVRLAIATLGLAFAALIVWAIRTGDFRAAGNWLTSDPWGMVTLADLYLGFLLTAVVIAVFEPPLRAVLWIIPLPFLGNVWAVIWFVMALPRIALAAKTLR